MSATTRAGRLSERAQRVKPSSTLAVSARVRELRAEGVDVIGFAAGEPDFDTPAPICDAAITALRAGMTRYVAVPGTIEAREAIANKLRRDNGLVCTANDIVITVGGKSAVYLALLALVEEGREVVIPTPAWVSYRPMTELCGGTVVEIPTGVDSDFKATPEQIDAAITERTSVLLLNSPSNPCGTTYTPEEIGAIADVLAAHDHVTVISDEIYEHLVYGRMRHVSIGADPRLADRVITVNGMSKAYAMTGWRLGYLAAPSGDRTTVSAITRLQGQINSHVTSFCYAAIVEAITSGAAAVERMRQAFGERASLIYDELSSMPGIVCPRPTGAFYVFPQISAYFGRTTPEGRSITNALSFAEALLEEAKVAVVPGDDFGGCGPQHVRMSFACDRKAIEEGCARMRTWLAAL